MAQLPGILVLRLLVRTASLWLGIGLLVGFPAEAGANASKTARLIKVLPHYLDKEGRHTINPSLFDRDAYQYELRQDPELRSGLRFDVQWRTWSRSPGALTIKLELRGSKAPAPSPVVVSVPVTRRSGYSQWDRLPLGPEDYARLGELMAWRVTLWRGDELLAEQKSFLW
jgi:hypothetical protein